MYERFQELLKINDCTVADLCHATGLKESSLSNWKKRNRGINAETLVTICRYFNASADWFLGLDGDAPEKYVEPKPAAPTPFFPADEQELLDAYRKFNDAGKASIRGYMEGLMQNGALLKAVKKEGQA